MDFVNSVVFERIRQQRLNKAFVIGFLSMCVDSLITAEFVNILEVNQ